jgi:salicylate hydroxylase
MRLPPLYPLANENAGAALQRARRSGANPVLIAGGGIGGLATALALARRGIASHVMERRETFQEEGAGIQIGPNGTRILKDLGVADALQPLVGVPEAISVRDGRTGARLARLPLGQWIATRHGAPYWVAHRKDLHGALVDAVRNEPLIAVSLGFEVSEIAADAGQVAVAAENGDAWAGKALIAADGIWSGLRTKLISRSALRFSGKSAARTVIALDELPAELQQNETTIWLFPDAHVVHYPISGGAELAVIVVLGDQHDSTDWSAPVPPTWIQNNMPECAEPLQTLILAARSWKRWALQTMPALACWTRGPIALLGDAAHPVLPFFAAGAVMALEDAVVVADALAANPANASAALKIYERARRGRIARVTGSSERNGRIYHLSGAAAAARNYVLRRSPSERLMTRYDWLYGWRNG